MKRENVRITILVDNIAGPGMMSEHGLSFFIETEDKSILFDTGQGPALLPNAAAMKKDLRRIDMLILSHGHYDHSGAVDQVLHLAPSVDIYAHSGVVQPRYKIVDGTATSLQMPKASMTALNRVAEERLHWVAEPLYLSERIGVTGPVPRKTDYEDNGGPFFLDPKGERKDSIADDLAFWIQTEHGLVVCVGCAHSGLVNTLDYVRAVTGESRIRAVIGGFHLHNAGIFRLEQTISALSSVEIERIIPCHCTGERTVVKMRNSLGDKLTSGSAGMTYAF